MNNRLPRLFLTLSGIVHPKILAKFGTLKKNLAKAGIKTYFKIYMKMTAFTLLLMAAITFTISFPLLLHSNITIIHALAFSILTSLSAGSISIGIWYLYPILVASSRKRNIEVNLPLIANFMAVLASAGMPPEGIFTALAEVGEEFSISKEVAGIIRDIKLMGLDLHTALKKASERSPSNKFAAMIDGVVTTIHMGGDLASYLREQANKYKRERMLSLRQFLDNLSVIAEAYVTFLVAAPLMLIVMLSVLSFIGTEVTLINLDPRILLNILATIILPIGISMLILAVEFLSPKR
ncbi:MAG: type II secretion system F family protein [Candidatus Bathyarchaeota archaeon]|nr:MAG: type II secretion system F family protein [Candidatus Bathyarchaeota archaeon]